MSQRLMKKIEILAKDQSSAPVIITMRSGREIRGDLAGFDWPNAVLMMRVSHQNQAHLERWLAHINMDLIESCTPAWSIAA